MSESYLSPVEQAIREAMRQGVFDNLPGTGKPLNLNWDEERNSPEDMRLANKIMKDHDVAPAWMLLHESLEGQHTKIITELERGFRTYQGTLQDADNAGDLGKRSRANRAWDRLMSVFAEAIERYNRNVVTYNLKVPPGISRRPYLDLEQELNRLTKKHNA